MAVLTAIRNELHFTGRWLLMVLTCKVAPSTDRGFILDINPVDTTLYIASYASCGSKYT